MTVGFHITVDLAMPPWLEAMEVISVEQWLAFNECLNFTAIVGL